MSLVLERGRFAITEVFVVHLGTFVEAAFLDQIAVQIVAAHLALPQTMTELPLLALFARV